MTAGKVMAAIKVDMCRQQPTVPQIVAARPSIVDLMRRRRGTARVCLFGVPDPGATQKIYDEMLVQQHQHMLNRWQFDMKTDRFVGQDESPDADAPSSLLELRLQNGVEDEEGHPSNDINQEAENRLESHQTEEEATDSDLSALNAESHQLLPIASPPSASSSSVSGGGGRVKCPKGQQQPRNNNVAMKPYDKNVRPITGTSKVEAT